MAKSTKWILRTQSRPANEIYKANMMALKSKDAALFNKIASLPENKNYQLYRDDTRTPYNLVFMDKGMAYYDLNDSIGVMENEIDGLVQRNTRIAIFFGIGLGYELLYYINNHASRSKTDYYLVIENDPYIFRKALEATDLTSIISRANITFAVGQDRLEFDGFYREYINISTHMHRLKSVKTIVTNVSIALDKEYYQTIAEIMKRTSIHVLNIYGNAPQDSLLGEKHMFMNMSNILENPGINLLYNKFRGKPAIVCASGPSLTKELPLLKEIKDKALILCAESTFAGLHAAGIHPHIMCTLERDDLPIRRFDKYEKDAVAETYLAAVPVVVPLMYETYQGPIINVYRSFNHFKWLPFDKGTLRIQKSSANMAFKLAHMLGCEPIILLGQDLCYDRETGKTHIGEHMLGDDQKMIKESTQHEVLANDGSMVKTGNVWFLFLEGYNIDVEEYGKEVINCSEKGAYIERTKYMPFKEVIDKYLQEDFDSLSIIRNTFNDSFDNTSIAKDIKALDMKLDIAINDLGDMMERCEKAVEEINQYLAEFSDFVNAPKIPANRVRRVDDASKKIISLKNKLVSDNETFSALVMHVVQSYFINFEINLNEKIGELEDDGLCNLYIVKAHLPYFSAMGSMIKMVKDEVDNAKVIVDSIRDKYQ